MNLRKDHSHAFKRITVNYWREVLHGDGDCINSLMQKLEGGRAGWVLVTYFLFASSCILHADPLYFIYSGEVVSSFFFTTFSDGCLGSNNDEGRSEV